MNIDPENKRGPRPPSFASLSRTAEMGWELGAGIVGLTLAGVWIDWRFGCSPTATIIGAAIGIVGGLYNFIRRAMRMRPPADHGEATARAADETPRPDEPPAAHETPETDSDDARR